MNKHSGGCYISKRNLEYAQRFCKFNNIELRQIEINPSKGLAKKFFFVNIETIKKVISFISLSRNRSIYLWIDRSIFSWTTLAIRCCYIFSSKKIMIFTFFHNLEEKYFANKHKNRSMLFRFLNSIKIYLTSIVAKLLSDKLFYCAKFMFNDKNKKSSFLPHTFKGDSKNNNVRNNYFYIGSNFFANIQEITKLIQIYSETNTKETLNIYGSVTDSIDNISDKRINLMGFQESLNECFDSHKVLIALIDQDYGMNVKIAEALHHGKIVLTNSLGIFTVKSSLSKSEKKMLVEYKDKNHLKEIIENKLIFRKNTSNVSTFKDFDDSKISKMFSI